MSRDPDSLKRRRSCRIAGKIFALNALGRTPLEVSVRWEPELAVALRSSYSAIRPGYHLNKRHWNTITLDGSLPDQLVHDLIEASSSARSRSACARSLAERPRWSACGRRSSSPETQRLSSLFA